jgi:hypothetical protein
MAIPLRQLMAGLARSAAFFVTKTVAGSLARCRHWQMALEPQSPFAFLHPERTDPEERECSVKLTIQRVRDGPDVDIDRPVSGQMETNIYDYYCWRPYWGNGLFTNGYGYVGDPVVGDPGAAAPWSHTPTSFAISRFRRCRRCLGQFRFSCLSGGAAWIALKASRSYLITS